MSETYINATILHWFCLFVPLLSLEQQQEQQQQQQRSYSASCQNSRNNKLLFKNVFKIIVTNIFSRCVNKHFILAELEE